jgi:hypothetical protein
MTNTYTQHDQEAITALYVALDFMRCNDMLTGETLFAIEAIEAKYK